MTNGSELFVFLIVPQRLTHVSNATKKISKSNKSELWNRLSYRGLPYLFNDRSQTFRNNCEISRSQPQNSTSNILWPQWPQKTLPNILKVASNQCICSKDWWKLWIVDRDRTKTKYPKQWGVTKLMTYSYLSNKRTCPLILFKKQIPSYSCNRLKILSYPPVHSSMYILQKNLQM